MIAFACLAVVGVVVWFVTARQHPENASTHLASADIDEPRNQADPVSRRPAGPDAENMSPERRGSVDDGNPGDTPF